MAEPPRSRITASDFIRQHGNGAKREAMKEVLEALKASDAEAEAFYRRLFEEIMELEASLRSWRHPRPGPPRR